MQRVYSGAPGVMYRRKFLDIIILRQQVVFKYWIKEAFPNSGVYVFLLEKSLL